LRESYDVFIKAADRIGSYLCKSAFWAGSCCNWIGRSLEDVTSNENSPLPLVNKALGPDIYDGTSGIAYFLSYLYDYTGQYDYLHFAEGAINHSLSHIGDIFPINRFGFYDGGIGIAYVAVKLGCKLDNNLLLDKAMTALKDLSNDIQAEHLMDIISGNAGAIPALLEIYDTLREQSYYDLAVELGDELLRLAVRNRIGWSWDHRTNGVESAQNNLTGFSHGAAGIAFSLLELFRKTGDYKYRAAAEEGFKYENCWFNETLRNWPDFRPIQSFRKRQPEGFTYAMAWCHGAPGICLSRIRAYQILQDRKYLKDCQAALSTVSESMKYPDDIDNDNYSLCHGLGGNCEPLLQAYNVFNDEDCRSIANNIGNNGIEKYGNETSRWPCGIQTGQTPGLMLGLAGIGHFYLRLYDSKHTPSALML
jgi:lantibiotic biosynthesis protein